VFLFLENPEIDIIIIDRAIEYLKYNEPLFLIVEKGTCLLVQGSP
jgi:hypothetical protein